MNLCYMDANDIERRRFTELINGVYGITKKVIYDGSPSCSNEYDDMEYN
ncbi:hypothetical protein EDD76_110123 [Kineothrix alysoides]|uniref:Uncharacterized protein n=1 Tax=Kineothrix alysoides TaxID=1469948 RepID=A0A4R1QY83_9FIRM|nr:hypothetical protein [Kineothrix alysoides]TCL56950.1 hypothetical protein EDD76_110123 [Kineothrix alysoides]